MTRPRTNLLCPLAKSVRTDPAELAVQGDDQIRTGVRCLGTDSVYERRTDWRGSSLAPLYAIVSGLMLAASFGWEWVAAYAVVVGPLLGWHRSRRAA